MRDTQRQRVYDWENRVVAPLDRTPVPFANIQMIVDYIWKREGLFNPPLVDPMPKQKKALGDSYRYRVRFPETTKTWIILHELAHSYTSTFEDLSNLHGANFMGVYLRFIRAYLGHDVIDSAREAGLHFNLSAQTPF